MYLFQLLQSLVVLSILLFSKPLEASSSGKDSESSKGSHGFDPGQGQWGAKLTLLIILTTNCFL